MSNVFAVLAGIGVGLIIAGATFFFSQYTNEPHYYNDDERRNQIKRCFKCQRNSHPLITLVCGHAVHNSCFYETLIRCKVSDLKTFKCPSCVMTSEPISYSVIKAILCSRCCVCKVEIDKSDREICCLPLCEHTLHKKCLEADILRHSIDQKIMYKCPYKLLECDNEMPIGSLDHLWKR